VLKREKYSQLKSNKEIDQLMFFIWVDGEEKWTLGEDVWIKAFVEKLKLTKLTIMAESWVYLKAFSLCWMT
jgi:hypothetical protein